MKTITKIIFTILLLAMVIFLSRMMAIEVTVSGSPATPEHTRKAYNTGETWDKVAAKPVPPIVAEEPEEPAEEAETIDTVPTTQATVQQTAQPLVAAGGEVEAIARTLAGECYDDMLGDKRKVAEVILNRVSKGYGNTVTAVVTAPNQFMGYYNQSRTISDTDREIATQAINDWYANGCQPLSDYLYFEAGSGKENVFRTTY